MLELYWQLILQRSSLLKEVFFLTYQRAHPRMEIQKIERKKRNQKLK